MTGGKRDEMAKDFTDNYLTMNNRPVHRPDVLQDAFASGWDACMKANEAKVKMMEERVKISMEINRSLEKTISELKKE